MRSAYDVADVINGLRPVVGAVSAARPLLDDDRDVADSVVAEAMLHGWILERRNPALTCGPSLTCPGPTSRAQVTQVDSQ